MPLYKIVITVDEARRASVEKKLKLAFGEDRPMLTVEQLKTPESRAARLERANDALQEVKSDVEELRDEMVEWQDSIPENLQNGEKAQEVDECCDRLDDLVSAMESLDFEVDFPQDGVMRTHDQPATIISLVKSVGMKNAPQTQCAECGREWHLKLADAYLSSIVGPKICAHMLRFYDWQIKEALK